MRNTIKIIAPFVIFTTLLVFLVPQLVLAWNASNYTTIQVLEDQFHNYDLNEDEEPYEENADWPVNMIFFGSATKYIVKNDIYPDPPFYHEGSEMQLHLHNHPYGWDKDADEGVQTTEDGEDGYHMRLYGYYGFMENDSWGYYVLGTSHIDNIVNLGLDPEYGWSEDSEDYWRGQASSAGYEVFEDAFWVDNFEEPRWEENEWVPPFEEHFWDNDGWASMVAVDADVCMLTTAVDGDGEITKPFGPGPDGTGSFPYVENGYAEIEAEPGFNAVFDHWSVNTGAPVDDPYSASTQVLMDTDKTVTAHFQPCGLLKVESSPAVPTTIFIDGIRRDTWGLDYVKMPPGEYTLSFTDTPGYLAPEEIEVTYYPPGGEAVTQPITDPIIISANETTVVTANFIHLGNLHVKTDPMVSTNISLNGEPPSDTWGFWVDLLPGDYYLSVSDVLYYGTPVEVEVSYDGQSPIFQSIGAPIAVSAEGTTEVVLHFIRLGNLLVETEPQLPATIFVDGNPMNDWGIWVDLEPGDYTVSFQNIDGYITPDPEEVTVYAELTTEVTGVYELVPANPGAGTPPSVTTNAADTITTSTATLNGNLDDLGTASSVDVSFEWGLTTDYGNTTTPESMSATGPFSADLTDLQPNTTYHFRAKAEGDVTGYGGDMEFTTPQPPDTPTIQEEVLGGDTSYTTNHVYTLPGGISSGDLLIVVTTTRNNRPFTYPEGWTQLFQTSYSYYMRMGAAYRIADGAEGSTITVTTNNRYYDYHAYAAYRITGYSGTPEVSTMATGYSLAPNPPSLAPSWGVANTLWLALGGMDYGNQYVNIYPTDYTDGDYWSGTYTSHAFVMEAYREYNASSEDPGNFSTSRNARWCAVTIAIRP